jgi:hypothetical protein
MDQGEKLAQTDRLERREHWDHPDLQAILEVSERRVTKASRAQMGWLVPKEKEEDQELLEKEDKLDQEVSEAKEEEEEVKAFMDQRETPVSQDHRDLSVFLVLMDPKAKGVILESPALLELQERMAFLVRREKEVLRERTDHRDPQAKLELLDLPVQQERPDQ